MRHLPLLLKRFRKEPTTIDTRISSGEILPESGAFPDEKSSALFFTYHCNYISYNDQGGRPPEQTYLAQRLPMYNLQTGGTIMTKLEGKVAVITGGNSGIGLATAQRFVSEGAYVYITSRRQSELDAAVKQIGRNVTAVQGDVSNLADLDRLYATVQQQHDHIDVVFANAGLIEPALLGEISEATFDKLFAVNVKGLLFTVQKALPFLREGSSIILTASTTTRKVQAATSVYAASKAAIRSFARTWTLDLRVAI